MKREEFCESCKQSCSSLCLCDCHTTPKVKYDHIRMVVGRLLTYIDATYQDQQQRKAHKQIVKTIMYSWYTDICKDQFPDEDWFCGIPIED